MNSKERVLAVFKHQIPDRPPLWVGMSSEFESKACQELQIDTEALSLRFGDDFRVVRADFAGVTADAYGHYLSPFGVPREGYGYGMPMTHPLAAAGTIAELDRWNWPSTDQIEVSGIRPRILAYHDKYAILSGDWSPLWHDAIDLVGMENLFIKMFDCPEFVLELFKRITDYYVASNRKIFNASADLIDVMFIGNDLGAQTGALLSPELFRTFLLPSLQRLFDLGHEYGLRVQMHCCGGVAELLDDLIVAGLDAIHAVQCTCRGMELSELKTKFGSRIILNGGIDSHHILLDGTPQFVKEKTLEVLSVMSPGGNYIAGASHDTILQQTPVENVLAMCDAVTCFNK